MTCLIKLHGANYFFNLDAASGFHYILLRPEVRSKTAFRTPSGHCQFKVLPFGLTTAPATFQTAMNTKMLNPLHVGKDGKQHKGHMLFDFVLVCIDDIVNFSKTAEERTKRLDIVFELLRKEQLQIKPSKSFWGYNCMAKSYNCKRKYRSFRV